jgi:uncharacterized OB-fold protein
VAEINLDTVEVWRGWQERKLLVARCQSCGTWISLPRAICPECWSDNVVAEVADGHGHLLAFSVPRVGPDAAEPVVTGIVTLDGAPGARLLARIVGCPPGELEAGAPVALDWREEHGTVFPQFVVAEESQ